MRGSEGLNADEPEANREAAGQDWNWLDAPVGVLDSDFVEAATEKIEHQDRPALNRFFR